MNTSTHMTCRVTGKPIDHNPASCPIVLRSGVLFRLPIPRSRQIATMRARQASGFNPNAVFFVETLADDNTTWINRDIYFRGHQYEVVGDRIPNFPIPNVTHILLGE